MASMLKGQGLVLALIIFIILSSYSDSINSVDARAPHNRARQLATRCNSFEQTELPPECGGGGGGGGSSGGGSGSSKCKHGCCGHYKWGGCKCC